MTGRTLLCGAALAALLACGAAAPWTLSAAAIQQPAATPTSSALHITSPLGRTGLVMRVRIVAQITVAPGAVLSPVEFFVDGTRVGTVQNGPPYAVEWVDVNPFEKRDIAVQATDSTGALMRDSVTLPPYEVIEKTQVTGVLLETSVYDKAGRFVSDLSPSAFSIAEDGVEQAVDLIIMTTHARAGLARAALGSVADRMLQATAPVLLVRPESA